MLFLSSSNKITIVAILVVLLGFSSLIPFTNAFATRKRTTTAASTSTTTTSGTSASTARVLNGGTKEEIEQHFLSTLLTNNNNVNTVNTPSSSIPGWNVTTKTIPPCLSNPSQLVYVNGAISATATFNACMNNVPDPGMLPTFYNGSYLQTLRINSTMSLNNLEYIDEIQGIARLQFALKLYWKDNRYAMPVFWETMDYDVQTMGIDLTASILDYSNIFIWLPVIRFPDASEVNIMSQYMKLNASNIFMLSYSFDITLVQPKFNFRSYPVDTQNLIIRFVPFNYNLKYVQFGFYAGNALTFNQYVNNQSTFKSNQIWNYKDCKYYTTTNGGNSYAVYEVSVEREGRGTVVRFILPIAFLLLLSTLTFWVMYENRVDITITLLLSVSALYIVILGNIPLVGYLTHVDHFVFVMFLFLVMIVGAHQWYATRIQKVDRWPLRAIEMRLIEVFGRVCVFPLIVGCFLDTIAYTHVFLPPTVVVVLAGMITMFIAFQELPGLKGCVVKALDKLVDKANNPETTVSDLSHEEVLVLNWIQFKKLTFSKVLIAKALQDNGSLTKISRAALQMKHVAQISELMGSAAVVDGNGQQHQGLKKGLSKRLHGSTSNDMEMSQFSRVRESTIKRSSQNLSSISVNPITNSIMANEDSDDEEDH